MTSDELPPLLSTSSLSASALAVSEPVSTDVESSSFVVTSAVDESSPPFVTSVEPLVALSTTVLSSVSIAFGSEVS